MKKTPYLLLAAFALLMSLLFLLTRPEPAEQSDPGLLAKVGNHGIRVEDFEKALTQKARFQESVDKQGLLEEMILRASLVAKAAERGLDEDPEVQRAFHNAMIGKLKARELTPHLEDLMVSDEEIEAHYQANLDLYGQPAKARLAIIFIATHPKMSAEKLGRQEERISMAREHALKLQVADDFGAVAVEYSEDQTTRYKGGDLGWLSAGQPDYRCDPAVLETGFMLSTVGMVSDVIKTPRGLYLVKLLDQRQPTTTPLKKVKEKIRYTLLKEKQKNFVKRFEDDIRKSLKIEVYPTALAKIPVPEGQRNHPPPALQ